MKREVLSSAAGGESSLALDVRDLAVVLLVALLWGYYAAASAGGVHEDAAMVLRYAKNVANGHGIAFNPGDQPVDGATDFLFTLAAAGGVKIGCSPEGASRIIGVISHILTVAVVYIGCRNANPPRRWPALLSAFFIAIGPAGFYIAVGFGTAFFAFWVALSWHLLHRAVEKPGSSARACFFAGAALAMGLARPEGFFMAVLMLGGVFVSSGSRAKRSAVALLATYLTVGTLFLVWRFRYFGHVVPLPFQRKGGTFRLSSLADSIRRTGQFLLPLAPAAIYGLSSGRWRVIASALIPTVGFASMWAVVSAAQNPMGRFQYPALFAMVMAWPAVLRLAPRAAERATGSIWTARRVALGAGIVAMVSSFWFDMFRLTAEIERPRYEGTRSAGIMLRAFRDRGYTIATSEAGIIPLYSEWRAIDTWGLNDPEITARGINAAMLDRARPQVIMFNRNAAGKNLPEPDLDRVWLDMSLALQRYAEENGYVLAAMFCDGHLAWRSVDYYYVKRDCPDQEQIVTELRRLDYRYLGEPWKNFADPGAGFLDQYRALYEEWPDHGAL